MDTVPGRDRLFPNIKPYSSGTLQVDGRHVLYWEQSGNPHGTPAVFLHGGPGAGASPTHRRFFDPSYYRVIIVDQRGCGRSRPYAEVHANTLGHLVGDLEALRQHLCVASWILFGGSWGSTLALAYAGAYPAQCLGLILRGIFLGSPRETGWFLNGMGMFFPEAYRRFVTFLPSDERNNVLGNYYRRLMHPEPRIHVPAARSWTRYESACSNLETHAPTQTSSPAETSALALARIEAHYFVHGFFDAEQRVTAAFNRIQKTPMTIVHGRYDMICPIVTADTLARQCPNADYVIVPAAGHSALEPGILSALVRATERMKGYCA